ncbi:hypothetical protein HK097_008452 [Rhizophlyctis rosea]|uniref:Uncharacterized protein n=1 Tax=Rhizophlyctis rosea TaxID=64517 RepID=A0AAD5SNA2_9FUNG|nr:hypothetical protein HK097_008452 [Rhizophlyctis rosea]
MADTPPPLPTKTSRLMTPTKVSPTKERPASSKKGGAAPVKEFKDIMDGLKSIYQTKIKPLEQAYSFDQFHSPFLTNADIGAKPMVLLVGQYSVGKSTFVKYILEKEYPGCHIGPEPTTDRFVAIMNGEERVIPGNAAAVSTELPFTALTRFGASFLSKFQVSSLSTPVLEDVVIIDTPGILSGEKQRLQRGYDFTAVIEWFAERADMILLLFDAHKLDISDEFKRAIGALRGHDEKIRVVLNKADMVSGQQLLRVYGAMMWSLGKVVQTPEVMRVYIGSFWDNPPQHKDCEMLLKAEQQDLLNDLSTLPRNAAVRKINEIVKRTRMAKVHALIVSHCREQMPAMFGQSKKQTELINNLEGEFEKIARQHQLVRGDFPDPNRFKEKLAMFKIEKFPKLDKKMLALVDEALGIDLPKLLSDFPQTQAIVPTIMQNPFENLDSPAEGVQSKPTPEELWKWDAIDRKTYIEKFKGVAGADGKVSGSAAKPVLEATGLDQATLAKIWKLSDWTKDGYLDADEFVVAMWICEVRKRDWAPLPDTLPEALLPHRKI